MQPKILLVDDREDNLLSIEAILAPSGYQFVKALSGRHALKILLKEFDFAMILMDVKMPNLNGFETASLIYEREKLKHIPIIFITANNFGDENMYRGYQSGAIDYIFKPINPDVLRAKVNVLVELYKKNRLLIEQEQKLITINKNLEREINERVASEERVKDLNRQLLDNINNLEIANKDLERFAFMASHDLQEPLRKIRIFCDRLLLKYHDMAKEDSSTIARIQQSAERMQALINDILAFSKMSVEPSSFVSEDLTGIVSELVNDMADEVKEKRAKITISQLPELSVSPGLMRTLFQNLINNAMKYKREGIDPCITIRSDGNNGSGKFSRIFIEDNGMGFDQKYAEEIFGMFRRLHSKDKFAGTGIGLALCKKIVEQHNGYISAQSKPDEGTTIIISLPQQNFSITGEKTPVTSSFN
jgi:signal transduction histidine kinase